VTHVRAGAGELTVHRAHLLSRPGAGPERSQGRDPGRSGSSCASGRRSTSLAGRDR
jgi:hypothetical protein